jgi:hypothetical protein
VGVGGVGVGVVVVVVVKCEVCSCLQMCYVLGAMCYEMRMWV